MYMAMKLSAFSSLMTFPSSPPKAPCSPLAVSQGIRHRPLGTTGQLPVTITSPFLEYHINGPILNVDFCDWLLSLGMVLLRLISVVRISGFGSSSLSSSNIHFMDSSHFVYPTRSSWTCVLFTVWRNE